MRFDEYRKFDATQLAALIAKREVSAKTVLEVAIARAEAINPLINAIVHQAYAQAHQAIAAGLPSGPLTGVPYLIKDLGCFQQGQPVSFGSKLYADFVADHDSAYISRCKRAGLVLMGRSASPEFGLSPNTEPRLYGACKNPWNLAYSAGGSSGGAAAAVSAGILPMAHATDGGGSIRIPAAHCGLVGLKPSRARISLAPDAGEGWGGMSVMHAVTRSVRDCALLLDATAGYEPGDPYTAPAAASFVAALARPPRRLKIAMMLKDHRGANLAPDCLAAVEGAAKLCQDLGHIVEEADPGIDLVALRKQNSSIAAANVARALGLRWAALGRQPDAGDVEAATWAAFNTGRKLTAVEYVAAIAATHAAGRKLASFLSGYDVILSTVVAGPPPRLGYFDMDGDVPTFAERVSQYLSVTPVHNATGTPAISLPLYWTQDGLPVGVHFAGRYGEDGTLLQLAAQLEAAQPWFDRVPAI